MSDHFKDLSKNKQLFYLLKKEIDESGLEPHSSFFTEFEIIEKYNVSRTTIRQAINKLVENGDLYQIQRKGTFISPKITKQQILVVTNIHTNIRCFNYPIIDFLSGLIQSTKSIKPIPIIVNSEEYLNLFHDIDFIYKNIIGVIFFRQFNSFTQTKDSLRKKGIPCLFYGSDVYHNQFHMDNIYLYNESEIVNTALSYLYNMGHREIGVLSSNFIVLSIRGIYYEDWMLKRGLSVAPDYKIMLNYNATTSDEHRISLMKKIIKDIDLKKITAFFCVDDWIASTLYHTIYDFGLKIPDDISIIGVNNYPFSENLYPRLTTINIPVYEDAKKCFKLMQNISNGKINTINEISVIKLIERNSVKKI